MNPSTARPIYYKPYRLLASQEDQIEDQVAAVKKAIRKEKEEWDDAKGEKIDGLEQAKRKRDEQLEEVERGEREVRQKRRREAEEKEEREKAQKGGDVQMVERSVDDVVREADKDDVAMASVPVVADEEEAAANEVDAGKAAIVVDEKMDGGDEDLEY